MGPAQPAGHEDQAQPRATDTGAVPATHPPTSTCTCTTCSQVRRSPAGPLSSLCRSFLRLAGNLDTGQSLRLACPEPVPGIRILERANSL